MLTAQDVAKYFLSLTEEDSGDGITNLKLQKLVYYAQGFYLAMYGESLFNEEIQAWFHGPVVPSLYRDYKGYGSNSIPVPNDIDFELYSDQVKELLNEVYKVCGQFSAWKLRELTHQEPPWSDVYREESVAVITKSELKKYFKTRLADEEDEKA
jgi:uncharacterized phage-associated protein